MKYKSRSWTSIISAFALFVLVLDTKTAALGAKEGIVLCINSVIPSLFPFLMLSSIIVTNLIGDSIGILRPIGRLCAIPEGAESLFVLGLLGGYPIGAQCVNNACKSRQLSSQDAGRMLGFCNNAGPAFIFGMMSGLFSTPLAAWSLWLIQITSALIVGIVLPRNHPGCCKIRITENFSIVEAAEKSIRTMANICGWVVLFRVLIAYLERWILLLCPSEIKVLITGIVELSNGCHALGAIESYGMRFVFASCFLSLGGICVSMQTLAVTKHCGSGLYFPGKLLQSAISFALSVISQYVLFPDKQIWKIPPISMLIPICLITTITLYLNKRKKVVAISG